MASQTPLDAVEWWAVTTLVQSPLRQPTLLFVPSLLANDEATPNILQPPLTWCVAWRHLLEQGRITLQGFDVITQNKGLCFPVSTHSAQLFQPLHHKQDILALSKSLHCLFPFVLTTGIPIFSTVLKEMKLCVAPGSTITTTS